MLVSARSALGLGLDDLQMLRPLGRGGFAEVHLARWQPPGHAQPIEVAVKIAHRPEDARMLREAEALRRVPPPVVPALLASGVTASGQPFLVMEYVRGDSLAARHRTGEPGAPETVMPLFGALCAAVAGMHAHGVIHCDLKPANVLLRDGRAVLVDLGLARWRSESSAAASPSLTRDDEWVGSSHYMAPEQWHKQSAVDARTDVYALGVIAFELLSGRLPFEGNPVEIRHGHVAGRCPPPSRFAPVSAAVDEVVLRAMAKDKDQRFASAEELAEALARALAEVPAQSPTTAPATSRGDAAHAQAGARTARPQPSTAPAAGDGPRMVALLALESDMAAPRLAQMVAFHHDAVLASAVGQRYLIAFPWSSSPAAAVRAALATAQDMSRTLESTTPPVVHLAPLRVRMGAGGVRLSGEALRRVDAWATPGRASALLLTEAAAAVLDAGEVVSAGPGWFHLAHPGGDAALRLSDPQQLPLRGRDQLLAALIADAEQCLSRSTPLLTTIEGEIGLGKSRLLQELATVLRGRPGVRVIYVRAQATHETAPGSVLETLLRVALDVTEARPSPAALDAAWESLGACPSSASRQATALLLRAIPAETPEMTAITNTPGALRQAATRALTLALRHAAARQPLFLLLDDAHRADPTSLDALERAALAPAAADPDASPTGAPLGIWVTASPRLRALRPHWGRNAAAGALHELAPLGRADAHAVIDDLLHSAVFFSGPVFDHLYALSGGVPLYLAELVRLVHARGGIRWRGGQGGYYLATDQVVRATEDSVDGELAQRTLEALPAPLLPLVELGAILGEGITGELVRGIVAVLEAQAEPLVRLTVDTGEGLAWLARNGLLVRAQRGYALRHPVLRQALEKTIPPLRRQALHAAVVAHGQQTGTGELQRLAYHASRSGAAETAAGFHLACAAAARRRHDYARAEQHYTQALEQLAPAEPRREEALAGRGSMRYRLQRLGDALEDLVQARALATARDDRVAMIELLLEEATVLDWHHEWTRSAERTAQAMALARETPLPALDARLALAHGRALCRRGEHQAAVGWLEQAACLAAESAEYEVQVIALLLLGPALSFLDRFGEAACCFDQVIERCARIGDDFHLAVAYLNRQHLWFQHQEFDQSMLDLEMARELGRQLGNVQFERAATFNLAEFRYWRGDLAESRALAERALELHVRFMGDHLTHHDHLLLARIACSQGSFDARSHVRWIEDHCRATELPPADRVLLALVRLVIAILEGAAWDDTAWDELVRRAQAEASHQEHVEVMLLAAEAARHRGDVGRAARWLAQARENGSSLWARRIDALAPARA